MNEISRTFAIFGVIFLLLSILFAMSPNWPKIPGDIYIDRPGFRIYIPISSSILVSVVLTILLALLRR